MLEDICYLQEALLALAINKGVPQVHFKTLSPHENGSRNGGPSNIHGDGVSKGVLIDPFHP